MNAQPGLDFAGILCYQTTKYVAPKSIVCNSSCMGFPGEKILKKNDMAVNPQK
jgi:hypothetical protein